MKITGEHRFTYRTFRHVVLDSIPRRWLLQGVGVVGLALILAFGYDADRLLLLVGLTLCVVFPELLVLLSWSPQRQQASGVTHYELDESGVRVRTATSDVSTTWSGMKWVKTKRHAWMMRTGVTQLPIPRAAFSPEDQATIDAFLATRAATPAG